jgi:hypothetical protein
MYWINTYVSYVGQVRVMLAPGEATVTLAPNPSNPGPFNPDPLDPTAKITSAGKREGCSAR